ncbi:hypothetical protein KIW84_UN0108 [Lathyrus oleraceus]|nr:hypothetical protein KIW84_UN0108 [Pisum sativum]
MFDTDPLAKTLKNERHCHGEFSMASVQPNKDMEDHNQVDQKLSKMKGIAMGNSPWLLFSQIRIWKITTKSIKNSQNERHCHGEFSMASVQSNKDMEDHNQVDCSCYQETLDADPLAKSLKNERQCHGEFSMAFVQSNKDMEDHNQVDEI